jgi:hypothetical protein
VQNVAAGLRQLHEKGRRVTEVTAEEGIGEVLPLLPRVVLFSIGKE